MTPAASVSGIYLAHPDARYFSVGRIGRDQVEDYAARKGGSTAEAERWLRPNLAYEPAEDDEAAEKYRVGLFRNLSYPRARRRGGADLVCGRR